MPGHIKLLEFEEKEIKKTDITDEELDKLVELNENFKDPETGAKKEFIRVIRKSDGEYIKARNWVGIVEVGDFTLEILPKLAQRDDKGEIQDEEKIMKNLLRMLQIAWDVPIREVEIASLKSQKMSIFEIILHLYSVRLLQTLKDGAYREYVRVEEDAKFVSGQIRFEDYAKNWPGRKHIVPIRYNDRNVDNPLNRALKYAAYLGSIHTKNSDNFSRLNHSLSTMHDVSLIPVSTSDIDNIHLTRLNESYRPLLNMAKVIIGNLSLAHLREGKKTFAFLVPMERVFESFIGNTLLKFGNRIFPEKCGKYNVKLQVKGKYLIENKEKRMFELIPDIYINCNGKGYIIDTKYKMLDPEDKKLGVLPGDAYQMFAYACAYKVKEIMLLYPSSLWGKTKNNGDRKWQYLLCEICKNCEKPDLIVGEVEIGTSINLLDNFNEFIEILKNTLSLLW